MSTTPKPEHVALANDLLGVNVWRATRIKRIAQAIADAEERGREAGQKEMFDYIKRKMFDAHHLADHLGDMADDIDSLSLSTIRALLDVKP